MYVTLLEELEKYSDKLLVDGSNVDSNRELRSTIGIRPNELDVGYQSFASITWSREQNTALLNKEISNVIEFFWNCHIIVKKLIFGIS